MSCVNFSFLILLLFSNCTLTTAKKETIEVRKTSYKTKVSCKIENDKLLASYEGPEFLNDRDTAHLLSNLVASELGAYLKKEFNKKNYLKVDFKNTKIQTKGNPQFRYPSEEIVTYSIEMPLLKVKNACDAFTGIEHRGTWARNDIESGFQEWILKLKSQIAVGDFESQLFKTPEGFKEYWVQFKHRAYQGNCR
jgi:hypothetical protein